VLHNEYTIFCFIAVQEVKNSLYHLLRNSVGDQNMEEVVALPLHVDVQDFI